MKRLLAIVLPVIAALSAAADAVVDDTGVWEFKPDGLNAKISLWHGSGTELSVPRTLQANGTNYVVTALGTRSIQDDGSLVEVNLPDSITNLDTSVFKNATNLARIVFAGSRPNLAPGWFGIVDLAKLTVYASMADSGWADDFAAGAITVTITDQDHNPVTYSIPVKSTTEDDSYTITADPAPGMYVSPFEVSLSCSRPAPEDCFIVIFYTTDGTAPTLTSDSYTTAIPVSVRTTITCFAAVFSSRGVLIANGPYAELSYRFPLPNGGPYVDKLGGTNWTFRVFYDESYLCPPEHAALCVDPAPRGALAIPPELGGRPVVGVDVSAFERCRYLTDVTFPATIKTIGSFAFKDCIRLTNLVWQGTVPAIDLAAFDGCPIKGTGVTPTEPQTVHVAATIVPDDDGNVAVPESWTNEMVVLHGSEWRTTYIARFGEDFTNSLTKATGKKDAFGNDLEVWQDYVAGTDPLDPDDVFTASIAMTEEGPEISWSPDLSSATPARVYNIYAMKTLGSKLSSVDVTTLTPAERKALGYRFYYVTVGLR